MFDVHWCVLLDFGFEVAAAEWQRCVGLDPIGRALLPVVAGNDTGRISVCVYQLGQLQVLQT
jgi:hypothetical protein